MTNTELYISDTRCDLADDSPIAITLQVNDLADIKDRQSTYSNSIKLPKTSLNKQLLGHADSDSFTQYQPYTKLPAKLVQDGVEVIPFGNLAIQRVSDYFEAQITYGLVGISDLLKIIEDVEIRDAKLKDLDWSDIPNFNFDLATVATSQSGTGVLWPVIDLGDTLTTSATIVSSYLRPGIYLWQVINRIAKYIGYTFTGSILSNSTYLNDFIPFTATTLYDYQGTNWYDTHLPLSVINNLPDFTVKELLKDFMQRYFLTPIVDNYKKTIDFRSFNELYDNKPTSNDWTDKFIDDERVDEFTLNGYAQVNYLRWKDDEKYLTNGNGVLSINNTNLPLNTLLLTSIFANSDYKPNVLGGKNVAKIKKYPTSPLPAFGSFPEIDTLPRIINIKNAPGTYQFTDGVSTTVVSGGIKIGVFSDQTDTGIGWREQLLNFGGGLQQLLSKCRIITRYARLNPTDLFKFDFFTPVYDAKEAKYYYVNSISNYTGRGKTKVNLIRL